jgi:hypothetical protein
MPLDQNAKDEADSRLHLHRGSLSARPDSKLRACATFNSFSSRSYKYHATAMLIKHKPPVTVFGHYHLRNAATTKEDKK